MTLPVVQRPTSTLTIDGQGVEVRGLSRAEAAHFMTSFTIDTLPDKSLEERVDLAEAFLISVGVGVSLDEAAAWRLETDTQTVGLITDEVMKLSGLMPKDGPDPQPPTSAT